MRKLFVSFAVVTATLAAVPAAAQYHQSQDRRWDQRDDRNHRGPDRRAVNQLVRQLDQADQKINLSARRGFISSREAFGLRREALQIRQRLQRSTRNGLNGREFGALQNQIAGLERKIRMERRDRDRRRG